MLNHYLPILLLMLLSSCSYLPKELSETQGLIVEESADYIKLSSSSVDHTKAGIVFYPGGLVDPHAYTKALQDLALVDNRTVVILKVASNLAILNSQKASKIIDEFPEISDWVVGGHSLGGAVACMDVFDNPNSFAGLFLLAAYSVNDLSDSPLPVLSITASQDLVLDAAKFQENSTNLPAELVINSPTAFPTTGTAGFTAYFEIQGGNHAHFGNYGTQDGDGRALIGVEDQQAMVLTILRNYLFSNQL